jgi:putative transcription factor
MLCEMCGKEVALTNRIRIEGTVLSVCPDCEKFGTRVDPVPPPSGVPGRAPVPMGTPATRTSLSGRRMEERDLYTEIGELELAPDWPKRVRLAREAMGWTPEDLGKKLNEKKSVVLKLESGGIHPPDALVRKAERVLKTRLRADPASPA